MIFRDVFQSQQLNEAYAVFQIIILVIKNFLEILGMAKIQQSQKRRNIRCWPLKVAKWLDSPESAKRKKGKYGETICRILSSFIFFVWSL